MPGKLAKGAVVLACLISIGAGLIRWYVTTLRIQVNDPSWTSVTLSASDPDRPIASFKHRDGLLKYWPLDYGPYVVSIRFADGRVAWARIWQYDRGARRTFDLTIDRPDGQDTVRFVELLNGSRKEFEGATSISGTSQENPFAVGSGPA